MGTAGKMTRKPRNDGLGAAPEPVKGEFTSRFYSAFMTFSAKWPKNVDGEISGGARKALTRQTRRIIQLHPLLSCRWA
jgi:hypothetical protein